MSDALDKPTPQPEPPEPSVEPAAKSIRQRFAASKKTLILFALTAILVSCGKSGPGASQKSADAATKADPCENLRQLDPHCGWSPHWDDSGVSTNAIDGTKTEFLSLDSTDPDGFEVGRLTYTELRICFENGKLCGHGTIGVDVVGNGMIAQIGYGNEHSTSVRVKFDDEKPMRQTWGISDDHVALFPSGREKQFLIQLLRHKKLIVEFSYFEHAPRTVTFELSDLGEKMKSTGIDPKSVISGYEADKQAKTVSDRAKISEEIKPCKYMGTPDQFCWDPHDSNGEYGPFPTREVAINTLMAHRKR